MGKTVIWIGKIQSVNRWHGARALFSKQKNKWIGQIFETKDYKDFKKSIASACIGMEKLSGYIDLQVNVVLSSRADTGNVDKPIGDALELAGVIENDKFVRNITYYRHYHPNSGKKNKYNDMLMIELNPVPENELKIIAKQQKNDLFNLKRLI